MKKLKSFTGFIGIVFGLAMVVGGIWGICFTYNNVAQENIVTPDDAIIAGAPVRGPLTLHAQADIIRYHTLENTEGRTYAEMSREDDRSMWITATSLMTALNLGILAYGMSAIAVMFGLFMFLVGLVFIGKHHNHKKRK